MSDKNPAYSNSNYIYAFGLLAIGITNTAYLRSAYVSLGDNFSLFFIGLTYFDSSTFSSFSLRVVIYIQLKKDIVLSTKVEHLFTFGHF